MIKINRVPNTYEFNYEKGIVIGFGKNGQYIIDLVDYEKVSKYTWTKNYKGYWVTGRCKENNNKQARLHRYILDFPEYIIDHRDRDKDNNSRSNLVCVSDTINSINHTLYENNATGMTGVCRARNNTWQAYLNKNNKRIFLGYYENKEDAIVARLKGELLHYGVEIAPHRDLFKKYELI